MGGFVVTCIDRGHKQGAQEAIKVLELALFSLESVRPCAEEAASPQTLPEELQAERSRLKKSKFVLLGGRRDSDVLFIRNNSGFSETEIYNALIQHTRRVHYIRRVIPVQSIFTLTPENLKSETEKVAGEIGPEETFRVSLKKRLCSHFSSEYIISIAAECVNAKVDLTAPDKILTIEIAKDLCALSVLKQCRGNFNLTREPNTQ